jgi:hypothetical protein
MIEFSIMFGPASGLILVIAFFTKDRERRRGLFAAAGLLLALFSLSAFILRFGPD